MIIYTGRRSELPLKMIDTVRRFLDEDKNTGIIVMVPDQLTLETEIMLFDALNLKGSFVVNVVSPKRLCRRVFEEAGKPAAATIDEMGRAMIMGYLLRKHSSQLKYFKKAATKPGFEARVISEIQCFKQAGVTPEAVSALISESGTPSRNAKLSDIALLYGEYESRLAGHIQDGEDEVRAACERFAACDSVNGARVIVYGFDITTSVVNRMTAAMAQCASNLCVFLPLADNGAGVYSPMFEAIVRLEKELMRCNIPVERVSIADTGTEDSVPAKLSKAIFGADSPTYAGDIQNVDLAELSDELEDARFTAATVRKLVREKGWKYSDIRVVCCDGETSADTLQSAFAEYEVPFFTQEGRKASSNPLCGFLCETLKLISGKSRALTALVYAGFADISRAEAEALMHYMDALALKPSALNSPFTRGMKKELLFEAEPVRKKLMAPILRLKTALKESTTLKEQLTAIYTYLEELDCCRKAARMRADLQKMGLDELAVDDAQVWNKLMSTLDQLLELLGPDALPVTVISDLIERALMNASVKQLPITPDCVEISTPDRAGLTRVRCVILMGAVPESAASNPGVFTAAEIRQISEELDKYLMPDAAASAKTRRMYLKDQLALSEEYTLVTYHKGSVNGDNLGKSAVINEVGRIFPDLKKISESEVEKRILSSRQGAINVLAARLHRTDMTAAEKTAMALLDEEGSLTDTQNAASFDWESRDISREHALRLYRDRISVSRLEKYAGCPFAAFVQYGIRPDDNKPFVLNPTDTGNILHECVENMGKVLREESLTEEQAQLVMDSIADEIMAKSEYGDVLGDTAVAKATMENLKKTARRSARIFARQAQNREFRPVEMECKFGDKGEYTIELSTGEVIKFNGKIDRIDSGVFEGKTYVSIVDYKSSDKELIPLEVYLGMQLQLIIYLSVAMKKYSADSAGVYYFRMKDKPALTDDRNPESIRDNRLKSEKLKGIVPDDKDLLEFMAKPAESIYDVSFTKGELAGRVKKATQEQFERIVRHVNMRAAQLTEQMYSGNTEIRKTMSKDEGACRYCDYQNVCFRSQASVKRQKQSIKVSTYKDLNDVLLTEENRNEEI